MHTLTKIYTKINVSNNKREKESGSSGRDCRLVAAFSGLIYYPESDLRHKDIMDKGVVTFGSSVNSIYGRS